MDLKIPGGSKFGERFVFATCIPLTLWLLAWSFNPAYNDYMQCNLHWVDCSSQSDSYWQGYLLGSFMVPILLGVSYLALGLAIRRNRIKKERMNLLR